MRTLLCMMALLARLATALPGAAQEMPCLVGAMCGDGDFCNGVERCMQGECFPGPPLVCDDGDPCTHDLCEPAVGCVHVEDQCPFTCAGLANGTRCSDGTICTRGDACSEGSCIAGPPVDCDDGDPCTREDCDPRYGCVYREEAVAFPCVPDCTGGVADFTRCPGDGDICTVDACLPSVDLIGDPHMCIVGLLGFERACLDNDLCNGDEFCSPLLGCQPGPPLSCDDGQSCNGTESCDPALGCRLGNPEADGTACDDRRECTTNDACSGGACVGAPLPAAACDDGDAGTVDACEEGFGCVHCRDAAIGRVGLRGLPGTRGRLTVRGSLPPLPSGTIEPLGERVAVLVDAGSGSIFRAVLPAGSLEANATGRRFRYSDSAALVDGVRTVRLQERGDGVRWTLVADLDLPAARPAAVTVRLLVGSQCFRASASCSGPSRSLRCR